MLCNITQALNLRAERLIIETFLYTELSMFQERIELNRHLFRRVSRQRRNIRSITGTPKAIVVKVNGQNVYASDGEGQNVKPTSKVLQGTQSPPLPSPPAPFPKSHNINLHINLSKLPSSVRIRPHNPIFVSSLSVPKPQPQPIVALVPQSVQAVQAQVQPPMVSQVLPVIVSPSTTPTTEKSSGSSLKKILLAAALLKGISGSDSSEDNSQALTSLLSNSVGTNASPVSSNPSQGYPSLGYPQIATPQLGFPAQGTGANIANAGLTNPSLGNQNMGYPAGANQNLGYPNSGSVGYPPGGQGGGNSNIGYPVVWNTNTGYPNNGNVNKGYPVAGNPNTGYQGGRNANMGYPVGGNPNLGYPTGGNPALGYPTGGNPALGYPTGGNPGLGYPTGGNPGVGYSGGGNNNRVFGNGNMGYPAVGNENMGYPAGFPGGGNQNMGYPGGEGGGGGNMVTPTVPNFLSGTASPPVSNPNGRDPLSENRVLFQGQNTASAITPSNGAINVQGQNGGTTAGTSPEMPMSACWCGCEADCPHPCDLCSTSPTNTYSYYSNYNGNENVIGASPPTRKG
ncbi:hypothetical protein P5673_031582 [Acropora cervicornis]|uniref:Uncharacterized protein n=1 Tax=Acropora cervicornis TaxID=6130 RepID=A0AAD9PSG6_ACRCE|nr:hypothetical protein P5673_031582 [Acropora cervicornis]